MTFITNPRGFTSSINSNISLTDGVNTTAYTINTDTAAGATVNTITLGSSASVVNNFYDGEIIEITSGPGQGYIYNILSYVGVTKVVTLTQNFIIIPDNTSVYTIHLNSGQCQVQDQIDPEETSVKLSNIASSIDDFYINCYIVTQQSLFIREVRFITAYNGTTKVATISGNWINRPDSQTFYIITGESGVATSGTSNSIELDGNQTTIAGTPNLYIDIISGTGAGQIRKITGLSTNTLSITPNWSVNPTSGSKYNIFGGWGGSHFEPVSNYSLLTSTCGVEFGNGEKAILNLGLGVNSLGTIVRNKGVELTNQTPTSAHTLTIVSDYFRIKFISVGTTMNGFVQTIYNTYKSGKLTGTINEQITGSNDCELTRSVLTGTTQRGRYVNTKVDTNGTLETSVISPNSAFGDISQTQNTPIAQMKFTYGISNQESTTFFPPATTVLMNLEGSVGVSQIQTIQLPEADLMNSSGVASYFTLEDGGGNLFYVWYSIGTSADPTPGGTGLSVTVTSGQTSSQVATATQIVMNGDAAFTVGAAFGNLVTVTNATSTDANPTSMNVENMPSINAGTVIVQKGIGMAEMTNADGVGDFSLIRSRRGIKYRPGQGVQCIFSGIYGTPTPNTLQYMGVGNAVSAIYIGYNGVDFGVSLRSGGLPEIRTLTISSVSGASTGTIIVTVDGIDFTITLTDVSTTNIVAYTIAQQSYLSAFYTVEYVNSSIIFSSNRLTIGNQGFTFALGTATNITATFTTNTSAQDVTNTITNQNEFNIDRLDGHGLSGMVLNQQVGNIYKISYQWGFGTILFSVEDSFSGKFVPFHNIRYGNNNNVPALSQPDMKQQNFVSSIISTTPLTMKLNSSSLMVQGKFVLLDPRFGVENDHININSATSDVILLKLRNPIVYRELYNNVQIFLSSLNISSTKSANNTKATTKFKIVLGGTESSPVNETFVEENQSVMYVGAVAPGITLSNYTSLYTTSIPSEGAESIDLTPYNIFFSNNENIYIIYTNTAPSTGNIDIEASIDWIEDH